MTTFIRFGEIPVNEKSVNYFKVPFANHEDLEWMIPDNEVPAEWLEAGLSVFEMENGMPKLNNLQLASSLAARIGTKAYIVTGEVVGKGNDLEPLIANIEVISEFVVEAELLASHVFDYLKSNFKTVEENGCGTSYAIRSFCKEEKVGVSGTIYSIYEETNEECTEMKPYTVYSFNGYDFAEPVDGFDTTVTCRG